MVQKQSKRFVKSANNMVVFVSVDVKLAMSSSFTLLSISPLIAYPISRNDNHDALCINLRDDITRIRNVITLVPGVIDLALGYTFNSLNP